LIFLPASASSIVEFRHVGIEFGHSWQVFEHDLKRNVVRPLSAWAEHLNRESACTSWVFLSPGGKWLVWVSGHPSVVGLDRWFAVNKAGDTLQSWRSPAHHVLWASPDVFVLVEGGASGSDLVAVARNLPKGARLWESRLPQESDFDEAKVAIGVINEGRWLAYCEHRGPSIITRDLRQSGRLVGQRRYSIPHDADVGHSYGLSPDGNSVAWWRGVGPGDMWGIPWSTEADGPEVPGFVSFGVTDVRSGRSREVYRAIVPLRSDGGWLGTRLRWTPDGKALWFTSLAGVYVIPLK
jgi:hypothetical protein